MDKRIEERPFTSNCSEENALQAAAHDLEILSKSRVKNKGKEGAQTWTKAPKEGRSHQTTVKKKLCKPPLRRRNYSRSGALREKMKKFCSSKAQGLGVKKIT